jgi:hypothetical protein
VPPTRRQYPPCPTGKASRRLRSPLVIGLAAVCSSLLIAPGASAAPVGDPAVWKITPEHAVVAGVPVRVHLQGTAAGTAPADPDADSDPAAALAIVPPGVGCAPSYAETVGTSFQEAWHWTRGDAASEPFDAQPAVTFDTPGTYTGCGYFGLEGLLSLEDDPEATTLQFQPRPIEVARPTVNVALAFDGPLTGGTTIRVLGTASSNAPETVTVQLNRATDACGSTAEINAPLDRFTTKPEPFALYGGPRRVAAAVGLPSPGGDYRLCVYASRDGQSGDPDLAQSGPVVTLQGGPESPGVPTAPVADPVGTTSPPVQVAPPAVAPIDTSLLTPVVVIAPPVVCAVKPVAVGRGRVVGVRCPRGTGTIGVRLRRTGPGTTLRTFTLKLRGARARLRTTRLPPGTWAGTVAYRGKPAGTIQFVVLPPKHQSPSHTRKQSR